MKVNITITQPSTGGLNLWFIEHEWPVRSIIADAGIPVTVDGETALPELETTLPSAPQTCKTLDDHWENLTEVREWWWYNMFKHNAPAGWVETYIKKKWLAYTNSRTAWTNKHGSDLYRSYVCGTNSNKGDMGQETLVCKGNPVHVISSPQMVGGVNWYPIEAIDSNKPLPSWQDVMTKPWLCHVSNILYSDGHTSQFPQLGGNWVPLPVIARGGVLWVAEYDVIGGVRQRVLRKLAEGEAIPSPIRGKR